ncbi:MAG: hypothetical protein ACLPWS_14925 [Rhodomicrobium sp.]
MSDVDLVLIGAAIALMAVFSWNQRNSNLLFINAFFVGMYGVASYTGFQPASEAPYAFAVAIGLAALGFVLNKT